MKPILTFTKYNKLEEFLYNLDGLDLDLIEIKKSSILWDMIPVFYIQQQSNYLLVIAPNADAFEIWHKTPRKTFKDLWNYFKDLESKGVL